MRTHLVEEIGNRLGQPAVAPAAVDKHEPGQETELPDGIVRTHGGLSTFFTSNTHSHMRLLDHGHVVGAITDTKGHDIQPLLHHPHDGRLLRRANTTAQHGSALLA